MFLPIISQNHKIYTNTRIWRIVTPLVYINTIRNIPIIFPNMSRFRDSTGQAVSGDTSNQRKERWSEKW
jgi:hypothetical protein